MQSAAACDFGPILNNRWLVMTAIDGKSGNCSWVSTADGAVF